MAVKYLDKVVVVPVYVGLNTTVGNIWGYQEGAPNKQDKVGDAGNTTVRLGPSSTMDVTDIYGTTSGGVVINFGGVQVPNITTIDYVIPYPGDTCRLPEVGTLTWDPTNSYYTVTSPDTANLFQDSFKDILYATLKFNV
jgi:hypothetical protein